VEAILPGGAAEAAFRCIGEELKTNKTVGCPSSVLGGSSYEW